MMRRSRTPRLSTLAWPPALASLALAPAVSAQPGAQASGRAEAQVVHPVRAVRRTDLSFGAIVGGGGAEGSVKVPADGSAARYANAAIAQCSGDADCAPHRAVFEVSGEPGRTYRVSVPEQLVANGARTGVGLPVGGIAMRSLNASAATEGGVLDKAGRDSFFVGGTLRVPAGTLPDSFRADLPVIVTYD